jgi:hypothetical protein
MVYPIESERGMSNMSPEMIDAAVVQLKMLLDNVPDIPENVRESGKKFVSDLDTWSETEKAKMQSQGNKG